MWGDRSVNGGNPSTMYTYIKSTSCISYNRTCRLDLKEAEKKSMSGKTKGGLFQIRAKNQIKGE